MYGALAACVALWVAMGLGVGGTAGAASPQELSADEPPPTRSWHATDASVGAHAPDADAAARSDARLSAREGELGPAIKREERMMVRALVRMILILMGVVVGMVVLARGARVLQARLPRWVGGVAPPGAGPSLHIVERLSLGPRHTLAWVERDGAAFLVAFGEGGTSLLGPVQPGPRPSFAATMAEVTHAPRPPDANTGLSSSSSPGVTVDPGASAS